MEEAPQTRRCCGGEDKTFSGHSTAGHSYDAAAPGAGVPEGPVSCKGHDKLRSFSGAPFRAKQLLPCVIVFFA